MRASRWATCARDSTFRERSMRLSGRGTMPIWPSRSARRCCRSASIRWGKQWDRTFRRASLSAGVNGVMYRLTME